MGGVWMDAINDAHTKSRIDVSKWCYRWLNEANTTPWSMRYMYEIACLIT